MSRKTKFTRKKEANKKRNQHTHKCFKHIHNGYHEHEHKIDNTNIYHVGTAVIGDNNSNIGNKNFNYKVGGAKAPPKEKKVFRVETPNIFSSGLKVFKKGKGPQIVSKIKNFIIGDNNNIGDNNYFVEKFKIFNKKKRQEAEAEEEQEQEEQEQEEQEEGEEQEEEGEEILQNTKEMITEMITELIKMITEINQYVNDVLIINLFYPFKNGSDYKFEIDNQINELIYGPLIEQTNELTEQLYDTLIRDQRSAMLIQEQKEEEEENRKLKIGEISGGNTETINSQDVFKWYLENDSEHDFFKGDRAVWFDSANECRKIKISDIRKRVQPRHSSLTIDQNTTSNDYFLASLQSNIHSEEAVLNSVLKENPTTDFFCKYIHFKNQEYKGIFFNMKPIFKDVLLQKYFVIPKLDEKANQIEIISEYIFFVPKFESPEDYNSNMITKIFKDMGINLTSCMCAFFMKTISSICNSLENYSKCLDNPGEYNAFCQGFETRMKDAFGELPFTEIKHIAKYLDPISTKTTLTNDEYEASIPKSVSVDTAQPVSLSQPNMSTGSDSSETIEMDDVEIDMNIYYILKVSFSILLFLLFDISVNSDKLEIESIPTDDDDQKLNGLRVKIIDENDENNKDISFYFTANTVLSVSNAICYNMLKGEKDLEKNSYQINKTAEKICELVPSSDIIKTLTSLKTFGDLFQLVLAYVTNAVNGSPHAFYTKDRLCIAMGIMLHNLLNPILIKEKFVPSIEVSKNYLPVFFLSKTKGLERYPEFNDIEIDKNVSPEILRCDPMMISLNNKTYFSQYIKQMELISKDFITVLQKNVLSDKVSSIVQYIYTKFKIELNSDDYEKELDETFKKTIDDNLDELKKLHKMLLFQKHFDVIINNKKSQGIFAKIFNCFSFSRKENGIKKHLLKYQPYEWSQNYDNVVQNYIFEVFNTFETVLLDCEQSNKFLLEFIEKEKDIYETLSSELEEIKNYIKELENIIKENKSIFCRAIQQAIDNKAGSAEKANSRSSFNRAKKPNANFNLKTMETDALQITEHLRVMEDDLNNKIKDLTELISQLEKTQNKQLTKKIKNDIKKIKKDIKREKLIIDKRKLELEKIKTQINESDYGREVKPEDLKKIRIIKDEKCNEPSSLPQPATLSLPQPASSSLPPHASSKGGKHTKSHKRKSKLNKKYKKTKRKTKSAPKKTTNKNKRKNKVSKKHKRTRKKNNIRTKL